MLRLLFGLIFGIVTFSSLGADERTPSSYVIKPKTFETSDKFTIQFESTSNGFDFSAKITIENELVSKSSANDELFDDEHIKIHLLLDNSKTQTYVFAVNHQGLFYDGLFQINEGENLDWDGEWTASVTRELGYWKVSGTIPWSNFTGIEESSELGVYAEVHSLQSRNIFATRPISSEQVNFFEQFEQLDIQVQNEAIFKAFQYYAVNRSFIEPNTSHRIGTDLFWQPNINNKFSLTLNPDFGQIESNDLVVNFSAIETFLREKRPFFADSGEIFDVKGPENLVLVHTPRIGGESFYADREGSDLLGAFKYSGKIGNIDLSVLTAFEDDQYTVQGREFVAARMKYQGETFNLGFSSNFVESAFIGRSAQVHSMDVFLNVTENISITSGLLFSSVNEAKSQSDLGGWLETIYQPEDEISHEATMFIYGNNLQLNDLGYVKRVNRKQIEYEYIKEQSDLSNDIFEEAEYSFEIECKTNFENEALPTNLALELSAVTSEEDEITVTIAHQTKGKDDLITRGSNSLLLPSYLLLEAEVSTREFSFGNIEFYTAFGGEGFGGKFVESSVTYSYEVAEGLITNVELSNYVSDSWLDWDQGNVVTEYNFEEFGLEWQVDYRFNGDHLVQFKFESAVGTAEMGSAFEVTSSSEAVLLEKTDNFSFADSAMQLRYVYEISKITAMYLSYSFGGEFEEEDIVRSNRSLFTNSISKKDQHNLYFKVRIKI